MKSATPQSNPEQESRAMREGLPALESVLCTEELERRPSRRADYETENRALVSLSRALADSPLAILQALADTILEVVKAGSAGISLLTEDEKRFRWQAIAGVWKPHIGGGTPRDFGPCGDVLDRNCPLLFRHFERRYTYYQAVTPPVEECLMVPFYINGRAVGTIWVIAHDGRRTFDNEDLRMLVSLGHFASAAYQAVEKSRVLRAEAHEHLKDTNAMRQINEALMVSSVRQHELAEQARKAEAAMRHSEVRYRRLFQSAKDGILVVDAHSGKIRDANAFIAGLVGLDASQLVGKELHEIGMFKDIEENKRAFGELQRTGYLRHDHLPVQNQRGEITEVEFIGSVYEEGSTLLAQCNVRDISERSRLEKQIEKQAETLASEAQRKDEFLAMLSHELRNPLAPIRAAVHLLKAHERPGSENTIQRQAREVIERQVVNLTTLVGDLLEVSRVLSGRVRLNMQVLDMNQLVRRAIETVTPLIEHHRHTLSVTLRDEEVWASGDATRLEEVVINLLDNAVKYTPDGGRIEVACERAEHHVVVRVRDSGVGMDHDLLSRVFDLFVQADRSLDRSRGGLGIGLTLAHRLIGLHGGTIEARSEGAGKGSEFVVRLPPAPAPAPARADAISAGTTGKPEGMRVLLVDDNIDHVVMLASALRHEGYSVQGVYTGPDGLKVAQQWRPDIVLLDIGLPGLDGYEVARRLRADPGMKGTRLIALTGYGQDADIALGREAGFDLHLIKPYDFDDLARVLSGSVA